MARRKRSRHQQAVDRLKVSELCLKGHSQSNIAKHLGLSQPMISYDLKAIRDEWKAARCRNIEELVAVEWAKTENLERQAWQAFEDSKKDLVRSSGEIV